jgi:hypothetical protein
MCKCNILHPKLLRILSEMQETHNFITLSMTNLSVNSIFRLNKYLKKFIVPATYSLGEKNFFKHRALLLKCFSVINGYRFVMVVGWKGGRLGKVVVQRGHMEHNKMHVH